MQRDELLRQRLFNQRISFSSFTRPAQVVEHLGAMQAQEYAMARWAIALRLPGATDVGIEAAFNKGHILRTHILRPTWHFVSPPDIRWMLRLSAPRVHAASAYMYRQCQLDAKVFRKTEKILEEILTEQEFLTREEIKEAFAKHNFTGDGMRIAYAIMSAELEGLVCSGPRRGKQFTYALIDRRVKKHHDPVDPLTELASRYFASRGPATVQDFALWSGLTLRQARAGAEALPAGFKAESHNGNTYYFKPLPARHKTAGLSSFLMPDYDEYGIGYKDRSAIFDPDKLKGSGPRSGLIFNRMIVLDGRIEGSWRRTLKKGGADLETKLFGKLNPHQKKELDMACARFLSFAGNEE